MKKSEQKLRSGGAGKTAGSFFWLLAGLLLLSGLLAAGIYFFCNCLFSENRHFTLQELKLQEIGPGYWGKRYSQIAQLAGICPGKDNLWKIRPADVRARILKIPAVNHCEVRRVLPDTLQITISERIPRAAMENPGSSRVLADDGMVLNRFEALKMDGELPVISGFKKMDRAPVPGSLCPEAGNALRLLGECLQNYPDISILYVNIANPAKLDCSVRYRNRRSYRVIFPADGKFDYLMAAFQSAVIDVLKNNDSRSTFDLRYDGQVVIR